MGKGRVKVVCCAAYLLVGEGPVAPAAAELAVGVGAVVVHEGLATYTGRHAVPARGPLLQPHKR